MNKERKNIIKDVIARLLHIKAEVDRVLSKEEDARDNTPESFQDTEVYESRCNACDSLTEAVSTLEDVISSLQETL